VITVHVKLFATLRRYHPRLGPGEAIEVELPDGATAGQLVERLGLPADHVQVILVDRVARDPAHPLAAGDEVLLFPPVGGG